MTCSNAASVTSPGGPQQPHRSGFIRRLQPGQEVAQPL